MENSELKYRQEVEHRVKLGEGVISSIGRKILDQLATEWKISRPEAEKIEKEVLAPDNEHKQNLKKYEEAFAEAFQKEGYELSQVTREDLKYFQEVLELSDKDVSLIEKRIVAPPDPGSPKDDEDYLISEQGIDYTNLRDLLASKQWREADQETLAVMLKVVRREAGSRLRNEDIREFPCEDFHIIDTLWVKYSEGHFGFSVQNQIWESVTENFNAPIPEDLIYETYKRFGDRTGWRVRGTWLIYNNLTFTKKAPKGYLPSWEISSPSDYKGEYRVALASRLVECKL